MKGGIAAKFMYGQQRSSGFTIIELMFATMSFSVVLLVITAGIMQVSNRYYKGVTSLKTQSAARASVDAIAQAIKFANGPIQPQLVSTPSNTVGYTQPNTVGSTQGYFCAGNQIFVFNMGQQIDAQSGAYHDALIQATVSSCPDYSAPGSFVDGWFNGNTPFPSEWTNPHELLGDGMRLAYLNVDNNTGFDNVYNVNIRVIYGDDDLITTPAYATTATCQGTLGNQFCAVSELNTTVEPRIN